MKRFTSLVLTLLITFSLPISASAAKPSGGGGGGGGGTKFSAKITITPPTGTINVNESLTLNATWTSSVGLDSSQWSVNGVPVDTSKKTYSNQFSGQSEYTFTPTSAGTYSLTFKIWKEGTTFSKTSTPVTVTVNQLAPSVIRYVSLGDSVATGTTSPLTADTNPYTDQFQTYLTKPGTTVIRSEFETDGDRTNELYDKLGLGDVSSTASLDQNMIDAIKQADVITLCIGGNNLMQACKKNNFFQPYDFFSPNLTVAKQGYTDFMNQYAKIMAKIDELDKEGAVVIVMTQYNPYNISDNTMHTLVDSYYFGDPANPSDGMDDIITGYAGTYNYRVADVFTEFDKYNTNMGAVTFLYPNSFTRNPHPNQTGQNIIRDLHEQQYSPSN